MDIGVVLTGLLSEVPLQQVYSHAGTLVLPSSSEGLPVIASDIPANLEVGLPQRSYYPLRDVAALGLNLRMAAGTPEVDSVRHERRRWFNAGNDWDTIEAQTMAVFKSVLNVS